MAENLQYFYSHNNVSNLRQKVQIDTVYPFKHFPFSPAVSHLKYSFHLQKSISRVAAKLGLSSTLSYFCTRSICCYLYRDKEKKKKKEL